MNFATTLATSAWDTYNQPISAAITVFATVIVAVVVDRLMLAQAHRLAAGVTRGGLSATAETRLRFVRRLIIVVILLVGLFAAIAQFTELDRLATSILASGAIAAAVVGFAAKSTLANAISGIVLVVSQPVRVGDRVSFEDYEGTVEDIKLSHTVLHTKDASHVLIPNDLLASSVVVNHTLDGSSSHADGTSVAESSPKTP